MCKVHLYKSLIRLPTFIALHFLVTSAKSTTILEKRVADKKFSAISAPEFSLVIHDLFWKHFQNKCILLPFLPLISYQETFFQDLSQIPLINYILRRLDMTMSIGLCTRCAFFPDFFHGQITQISIHTLSSYQKGI